MSWIHNGRKYWYHNGRKYSKKIHSKNNNDSFMDISFGKTYEPKIEEPTSVEKEIMKDWEIIHTIKYDENGFGTCYWKNKKTGKTHNYNYFHPLDCLKKQ